MHTDQNFVSTSKWFLSWSWSLYVWEAYLQCWRSHAQTSNILSATLLAVLYTFPNISNDVLDRNDPQTASSSWHSVKKQLTLLLLNPCMYSAAFSLCLKRPPLSGLNGACSTVLDMSKEKLTCRSCGNVHAQHSLRFFSVFYSPALHNASEHKTHTSV